MFAKVIDKIVADYGDTEVRRKLLGADVKLTHGLARYVLRMSPEEQKAAVRDLIDTGELPRAKKKERSAAPPAEASGPGPRRPPQNQRGRSCPRGAGADGPTPRQGSEREVV